MDNEFAGSVSLLKTVGYVGICVALAWVAQVLGVGDSAAFNRMMWVLAAASLCGASVGLVIVSRSLEPEPAPIVRDRAFS